MRSAPADDPKAFDMLEAHLWGTAVPEGLGSRLPITTRRFTVAQLGSPLGIMKEEDSSNREMTVICEVSSISDENHLRWKLCNLERASPRVRMPGE